MNLFYFHSVRIEFFNGKLDFEIFCVTDPFHPHTFSRMRLVPIGTKQFDIWLQENGSKRTIFHGGECALDRTTRTLVFADANRKTTPICTYEEYCIREMEDLVQILNERLSCAERVNDNTRMEREVRRTGQHQLL